MGNQALYLKWRPQTFEDVIGQEHITATLRNSLRQGRIRHAYLFSGPRGTGKTTTARLLAKAVNCQQEDIDHRPCNECAHCLAVTDGLFFDLIEIDAASHTSVDDVRDLRDKIAFAPSQGQYKVYIIDEVHRFSGAAFDALLKTLEEPPAHAIFVLATTEIDKVPATIKSRCLLFEFRRVSVRQVSDHLANICEEEGISIDYVALELLARQGTGSVRDSISLLDQVVADPTEHISLELTEHMLGGINRSAVQGVVQAVIEQNTAAALDSLNEAIDMGADPRQFGQQLVDHWRHVMLVQVGGTETVDASDDMRAILAEQAQSVERGALLRAIKAFNTAVADLRGGWQPQLPLELAIVESTQPIMEVAVNTAHAPATPPPSPVAAPAMPPSIGRSGRESAPPSPPAQSQSSPPPAPPASGEEGQNEPLSFGAIQASWRQLKEMPRLRESRNKLSALLSHTTPLHLKNGTLTIGVPSPNFKPKVESELEMLRLTVEDLFGQVIPIVVEVSMENRQNTKPAARQDDLEQFGMNEFGGQISEID